MEVRVEDQAMEALERPLVKRMGRGEVKIEMLKMAAQIHAILQR